MLPLLMFGRGVVPLSAPTNLAAPATSTATVGTSWTNGDASAQTELYRDGVLRATKSPGTTSHSDTTEQGVEYAYQVRHVKAGGRYSGRSAVVYGSSVPPTIGNLIGDTLGTQPSLSWDKTSEVSVVRVYRDGVLRTTLAAGTTSFLDDALPDGEYDYSVRNFNGVNESAPGTTVTVEVTENPDLTAPTGFSVTTPFTDVAQLAWTDGAAETVEIYRGLAPNPTDLLTTVGAGVEAYEDTGRAAGTHYFYRIRHVDGEAFSAYAAGDATTPEPELVITGLSPDEGTDQITATWTLGAKPKDGYVTMHGWSDTEANSAAADPTPITSPQAFTPGYDIIGSGTHFVTFTLDLAVRNAGGTVVATEQAQTEFKIDEGA